MRFLLIGLLIFASVSAFAQEVESLGFNKTNIILPLNGEVSNSLTIRKSDLENGKLSIYASKASFSKLSQMYSYGNWATGYPAWEMTARDSSSEAFSLDKRHIEITEEIESISLDIWSIQEGLTRDPEGEIHDLMEIQNFEIVVVFENELVNAYLPVEMMQPFRYSFKLNMEIKDTPEFDSIGKLRIPINIIDN